MSPLHEVKLVLRADEDPLTVRAEMVDVACDMLELADTFSLGFPFTQELWEATVPDSEVQVHIDGSRVLSGYIDEQRHTGSKTQGSSLLVTGRDKGGRLVDESAPLVKYAGLTMEELVKQVVSPWFNTVTLSNARNRLLIKGKSRSAAISKEPAVLTGRNIERKVEPGESRAAIITHILERAELLAWSSADGKEFFVGLPNYSQAPQWHFLWPKPGTSRLKWVNVEEFDYVNSVGERYALITACGTQRGDSSNYGENVMKRRAKAKNELTSADGTGKDFKRPKELLISDGDIKSTSDAQIRADREMALRDASSKALTLTVPGFGQVYGGGEYWFETPAIYAFDTMARWENEESGVEGDYLITRVNFRTDKQMGQVTELALIPKGTELRAQ